MTCYTCMILHDIRQRVCSQHARAADWTYDKVSSTATRRTDGSPLAGPGGTRADLHKHGIRQLQLLCVMCAHSRNLQDAAL
jgi:hypothetical protein